MGKNNNNIENEDFSKNQDEFDLNGKKEKDTCKNSGEEDCNSAFSFKISDENLKRILNEDCFENVSDHENVCDECQERCKPCFDIKCNKHSKTYENHCETEKREAVSCKKRDESIKNMIAGAAVILAMISILFVLKTFVNFRNNPSDIESVAGDVTEVYGDNTTIDELTQIITEEDENNTCQEVISENGDYVPAINDCKSTLKEIVNKTTATSKNTWITTAKKTTKPSTTKLNTSKPTTKFPKNSVIEQAGLLGFLWSERDEVFYSAPDPWQRQFGYNKAYDAGAKLFVIYMDTLRIKFNYADLDWMVQCWKGQYGFLFIGAEVGVYNKKQNTIHNHYQSVPDKDRLQIGYTVYNKGDVLFERSYQYTWWLTGFVGGKLDKFSDRSQLTMKIRITLKDIEMADKFVQALEKPETGFVYGNANEPDTFYRSGVDVYFMWKTNRETTT